MIKEWYIYIEGKKEGPYTREELKSDYRITPDTLVWKKGYPKWVPIRDVEELQEVFKDDESLQKEEETLKNLPSDYSSDGIVIDNRGDPPQIFLWVIFTLLLLLYMFYRLS